MCHNNTNKMGFNVQGFATDKKFSSPERLAGCMGLGKIQHIGETRFENGVSFFDMQDHDLMITNVQNGTIVMLGPGFETGEMKLEEISREGKALRFLVVEAAGVFSFEYFREGRTLRSILTIEGAGIIEEGEPLDLEREETNPTEIIFGLIREVTGTHFYSIEPDQRSQHYRLIEEE